MRTSLLQTKNLTLPNQFYNYYYYFYRQTYDMFNGQYNLMPPLRFSQDELKKLPWREHSTCSTCSCG